MIIICSGFVLCIPSDFLRSSHDEAMMNRHVLVKSVAFNAGKNLAFREGGGAGLWRHPRKEAHGGSLHLHHEIRPQGTRDTEERTGVIMVVACWEPWTIEI